MAARRGPVAGDGAGAKRPEVTRATARPNPVLEACVEDGPDALAAIVTHADEARALKTRNMHELLDVFITPFDKQSIYRLVTQLDWIALSVKHFRRETAGYGISSVGDYRPILAVLPDMAVLLEKGVERLAAKNPEV